MSGGLEGCDLCAVRRGVIRLLEGEVNALIRAMREWKSEQLAELGPDQDSWPSRDRRLASVLESVGVGDQE